MSTIKTNVTAGAQWVRLLYMAFFCLCLYIASIVLPVIVVAQFLFVLFNGTDNEQLRRFGWSLTLYVKEILLYLTYNSNDKPFPFQDWPDAEELDRRVYPEGDVAQGKLPPAAESATAISAASAAPSDTDAVSSAQSDIEPVAGPSDVERENRDIQAVAQPNRAASKESRAEFAPDSGSEDEPMDDDAGDASAAFRTSADEPVIEYLADHPELDEDADDTLPEQTDYSEDTGRELDFEHDAVRRAPVVDEAEEDREALGDDDSDGHDDSAQRPAAKPRSKRRRNK